MRIVFGVAAVGLITSAYFVCPDATRDSINERMMPDAETLSAMGDGIQAIMRHLDGPGDLHPDAPV